MSWIHKLYETYENCQSNNICSSNDEIPLLPICHTTVKAHIEIVIDQNGNFKRARVIPKGEAITIVPCTESSGGRSGNKPVSHPLADKLQYIAGDFTNYGGQVTVGFAQNTREPFENYKQLLKNWCESKYTNAKIQAVMKYIEKESVIEDLINYGILFVDKDKKLLSKWTGGNNKNKPEIYKVMSNSPQWEAFVRWVVEDPGILHTSTWTDFSLLRSWIDYYTSTKKNIGLCYVTGKESQLAAQHPAKLRNDSDKAKLISSNDNSGFTFRGRFITANQACEVGFEVTQKAHNALRWLIRRQGYRKDSIAIVAWATSGKKTPDPVADAFTILGLENITIESKQVEYTAQELAIRLRNMIAGYGNDLGDTDSVVVMGLDSATPGRMSITFYRELTGSDFLKRIENWHNSCAWFHDYRYKEITAEKKSKSKRIYIRFVGAPAPEDIAKAAYGEKTDKKLITTTVKRILPCIVDGQVIPRDLMSSAVYRASNRIGMENWEWKKTLSIACALYKKYLFDYNKEVIDMALDETRRTRDYLYGRLLALADSIEQRALSKAGETRQTNAARLMQRFAEHPNSTWRTIELSLGPYLARLGGLANKRRQMITQVVSMFDTEDFNSDKKLSGEFLLGYHCQLEALRKKEEEAK